MSMFLSLVTWDHPWSEMSWFRTTTWLDIFLLISPSLLILKTNPRDSKTRNRNNRSNEDACKFVLEIRGQEDYQKDGSHVCINPVYSLKTVPQFYRPRHPRASFSMWANQAIYTCFLSIRNPFSKKIFTYATDKNYNEKMYL